MIAWPDLINGLFEAVAGLAVLNHCRTTLSDKSVAGVSIVSTAFFTLWGFWNLYYYPTIGQGWSFFGGLVVVAANCFWVALLYRYRRRA